MFYHSGNRFHPVKIIAWIVFGVIGAAALALVFGFIVMALWNWLMPDLFGLPGISYWQAWGIVLLAHILFKGGMHHNGQRHEKHPAGDEWKERFRKKFDESGPNDTVEDDV